MKWSGFMLQLFIEAPVKWKPSPPARWPAALVNLHHMQLSCCAGKVRLNLDVGALAARAVAPAPAPHGAAGAEDVRDEMMLVEVPDGLGEGDEMIVTVGGRELIVIVPPGCRAGSTVELEVAPPSLIEDHENDDEEEENEEPPPSAWSEDTFVDIELPPDCEPGQEMEVEVAGSARPISFIVPKEGAAASPVRVLLPRTAPNGGSSMDPLTLPPPYPVDMTSASSSPWEALPHDGKI